VQLTARYQRLRLGGGGLLEKKSLDSNQLIHAKTPSDAGSNNPDGEKRRTSVESDKLTVVFQ